MPRCRTHAPLGDEPTWVSVCAQEIQGEILGPIVMLPLSHTPLVRRSEARQLPTVYLCDPGHLLALWHSLEDARGMAWHPREPPYPALELHSLLHGRASPCRLQADGTFPVANPWALTNNPSFPPLFLIMHVKVKDGI